MNTILVESKIASLDTFPVWKTANGDQQRAFNAVPFQIDANNTEQLMQQLGYLSARNEQMDARQKLMQEIATQDERFLPLAYRIGALAAFEATDKPLTTKYLSGGRTISLGFDDSIFDRYEQRIISSSEPVDLAVQVGDELERIKSLLDTKKNVPVVMVWNHQFGSRRTDYDEVVMGEIPNPRDAFILEEPKVNEVDGTMVADFTIPSRLQGVVKGFIIMPGEGVHPKDKYANPLITTLVRLGVAETSFRSHDPDALYIGTKDVADRVAKAEQDKVEYIKSIERSRLMPRHIRR